MQEDVNLSCLYPLPNPFIFVTTGRPPSTVPNYLNPEDVPLGAPAQGREEAAGMAVSLTKFEYDVFLSHSNKDKPIVRKLADKLAKDGVRVWLDERILQPGDSIPLALKE